MLGELRARAWQLGTAAAGTAALLLGVALGVTTLQKNAAVRERDALHAQINAPVTGYIAEAARCAANTRRLDAALTTQAAAVDDLQAESSRRIAAAERGWRDAQRAAATARSRADRLAAAPIAGETLCERMEAADRTVLEILGR